MSQEQLFAAALALPPESRIELAGKLYESVDESAAPPVDPQLLAELDRRMAAYERGAMKTYTHEEVFTRHLAKPAP
ncbi:MAG TPA: addiction module protein [Pirellulaceae bacterium]|nr:addiction module protein [Pirellulaceae bacterium]